MSENPARFGCAVCKFFARFPGDDLQGECRRGAPVAAPTGQAIWPVVDATLWCGDGRKREAA